LSSVYLVRHAMTVVDPSVPSHDWVLSDDGRRAAAELRLPRLPARTSSEQKAIDTAALAGLSAQPDDRLREVTRPFDGEGTYEDRVRRYLAGETLMGWESRAHALERLHAALDGFEGIAVTHGLAISLYAGLDFAAWQTMPFPAVIEC
jgi:broad specificity phosphatase PhoE